MYAFSPKTHLRKSKSFSALRKEENTQSFDTQRFSNLSKTKNTSKNVKPEIANEPNLSSANN